MPLGIPSRRRRLRGELSRRRRRRSRKRLPKKKSGKVGDEDGLLSGRVCQKDLVDFRAARYRQKCRSRFPKLQRCYNRGECGMVWVLSRLRKLEVDVLCRRAWKNVSAKLWIGSAREKRAHLASELLVDRRERVELVLEVGGVLLVEEAACVDGPRVSTAKGRELAAPPRRERVHLHLDGLRAVDSLASALAGDLLQVLIPYPTRVCTTGRGRQTGVWERAGGEPRSAPARMRHITCSSRQRASGGCSASGPTKSLRNRVWPSGSRNPPGDSVPCDEVGSAREQPSTEGRTESLQ